MRSSTTAWSSFRASATWFDAFVQEHCELEAVTAEIAVAAGRLRGQLAARGMRRSQADMLIAATAYVRDLTLTTRNVRDFAGCGIKLLDPFQWGKP